MTVSSKSAHGSLSPASNIFVPDPGEIKTAIAALAEKPAIEVSLKIDMRRKMQSLRALHGVTNYAPVGHSAMNYPMPVRQMFKSLKLPYSYFHDAPLENPGKNIIDITRIFPIFSADENNPDNYLFAETDAYLKAVIEDGVKVIYRLGESIECAGTHFRTSPPKDFAKWTRICLNIVRHYNEGWANGFHWDIQDWAVWEEPNNPNLWNGAFEEYLELYSTIAPAFKKAFPWLNIGGPETTTMGYPFLEKFLAFCREKKLPLDFVSYTSYYVKPAELLAESVERRRMMDSYGFKKVPLWTNEWHCSPIWTEFSDLVGYRRERARFGGAEGAVFAATVLCGLQDSPLQRACYYSSVIGGGYGLFDNEFLPTSSFYVFQKFSRLFQASKKRLYVQVEAPSSNTQAIASQRADGSIDLLCGCFSTAKGHITLSLPKGYEIQTLEVLDETTAPRFAEAGVERIEISASGILSIAKHESATAVYCHLK